MIIKLDKVDSTNRFALRELTDNPDLADNSLIVADSQDAGRGRQGKSWFSPAGKNIYASYIVKKPSFPIHITLWICALAALKALRQTAPTLQLWLKWPNDIYCTPRNNPDSKLKIAGLLAETFSPGETNDIEAVVGGIGINLNMETEDLKNIDQPATSVLIENGSQTDLAKFADLLLENLLFFRNLAETSLNDIFVQWRNENRLLNSQITILLDDGKTVSGKVTDFNRRGEMILLNAEGNPVKIISGQIIEM